MEVWLPIKDYPNYQVSSDGRIKNINTGYIFLPHIRGFYLRVGLYTPSIKRAKSFSVNRLVAQAFLGDRDHSWEVNHKNGIKDDNRLVNLEWVTPSQNVKHSYEANLRPKGSQLKNAKLTEELAIDIKKNMNKASERTLAKQYGVSRTTIRQIKLGRNWSHVHE